MKIKYVATIRFPTEKAHGLQIAKMSEAFVDSGAKLTLFIPQRKQTSHIAPDATVTDFYKIKGQFRILRIPVVDFLGLKWWPRSLAVLAFLGVKFPFYILSLFRLKKQAKPGVIFTRELGFAFLAKLFFPFVFAELHDFPRTKLGKAAVVWGGKFLSGVIVTNRPFYDFLIKRDVEKRKVLLATNATEEVFFKKRDRVKARIKLNLPKSKKIILLLGTKSEDRGTYLFLKAAEKMAADSSVLFLLVGKADDEQEITKLKRYFLKHRTNNVIDLGFQPHRLVPWFLAAANLLVIPFSRRGKIAPKHLSPLKVYEYMASRRPIIAADLPGLKEVFPEETAIFFKNNQVNSLVEKIDMVLENDALAKRVIAKAYRLVAGNTWTNRAKKIIDFMKERIAEKD